MPIGDLLEKLAKGEKLSQSEIGDLRLFGNQTQNNNSFVTGMQNGAVDINVKSITALKSAISNNLDSLSFNMQADLSVANNTATYLTFDEFYAKSNTFSIPSTNDRLIPNALGRRFFLSGVSTWASNATGYRAIAIEGFDQNDVSLGSQPLHVMPSHASGDNTYPIAFLADFSSLDVCAYYKIWVSQTSGGALTLKWVLLSVFCV